MVGTRFYRIWKGIKNRIYQPTELNYKFYGGKGIKTNWDKFQDFKDDMYKSYVKHCKKFGEKDTTINRIDSKGNYCKKNCDWATWKEQFQKRPQTKVYDGKTLREWSEHTGVNLRTLQSRIYHGKPLFKAIIK